VKPTAKRVVLQLLSAAAGHAGTAATLIPACAVLGVGENNVRVALARLVAAGTLEMTGRGQYRLGAAAAAMTKQVTSWRDVEKQVRRWDGGWAGVHLGRVDRSTLRRRDRALRLLGFRALEKGLHVRPDNLDGGVPALRERLYALGVPDDALVFRMGELDAGADARARGLWNGDKLSASYAETIARIERWLVAVVDVPPREAAREAFFFGGDVLRMILFDPRLPEPLVDVAARRSLVDAAKRLDVAGRRLFARLFGVPHGLQITVEDRHVN
jgi:phenylacetic acid degradation operon negative regulatory protein